MTPVVSSCGFLGEATSDSFTTYVINPVGLHACRLNKYVAEEWEFPQDVIFWKELTFMQNLPKKREMSFSSPWHDGEYCIRTITIWYGESHKSPYQCIVCAEETQARDSYIPPSGIFMRLSAPFLMFPAWDEMWRKDRNEGTSWDDTSFLLFSLFSPRIIINIIMITLHGEIWFRWTFFLSHHCPFASAPSQITLFLLCRLVTLNFLQSQLSNHKMFSQTSMTEKNKNGTLEYFDYAHYSSLVFNKIKV